MAQTKTRTVALRHQVQDFGLACCHAAMLVQRSGDKYAHRYYYTIQYNDTVQCRNRIAVFVQ